MRSQAYALPLLTLLFLFLVLTVVAPSLTAESSIDKSRAGFHDDPPGNGEESMESQLSLSSTSSSTISSQEDEKRGNRPLQKTDLYRSP